MSNVGLRSLVGDGLLAADRGSGVKASDLFVRSVIFGTTSVPVGAEPSGLDGTCFFGGRPGKGRRDVKQKIAVTGEQVGSFKIWRGLSDGPL